MNKRISFAVAIAATALSLAACGGGGGGSTGGGGLPPVPTSTPIATTTPTGGPTPTSTPTASAVAVGGVASLIASDGFGPATINGTTYSFDAAGAPLVGATVIIGPVPIIGATPPATLPAGDVSTTTSASGAFSLVVASVATAPTSALPFILPAYNITGFVPPASGYYIEVFGVGTDGKSASVPIPLHSFVAASTSLALHVTTTSTAEAGALVQVNNDRAANGAGSVAFDEAAQEAARLHAHDMAYAQYACHYDTNNVGPTSRYLKVGGLGLSGEGLGGSASTTTPDSGFAQVEADFLAEKPTNGGHFANLVDKSKLWIGLAAATNPAWAGTPFQGDYDVDYEMITPSGIGSYGGPSGYTNAYCPKGIAVNNS